MPPVKEIMLCYTRKTTPFRILMKGALSHHLKGENRTQCTCAVSPFLFIKKVASWYVHYFKTHHF
jgi:hypothetical protein